MYNFLISRQDKLFKPIVKPDLLGKMWFNINAEGYNLTQFTWLFRFNFSEILKYSILI